MSSLEELKQKFPDADLVKILKFISEKKGVDLTSYRRNFVDRHLRSRLQETNSETYLDYITHVREHPGEIELFLDELSINVTHFFRDRDVFEAFRTQVVPQLLGRREEGAPRRLVRIWSAACATGKEPYSIAMMMNEAVKASGGQAMVRVWATDVDADALRRAKEGVYEAADLKEIPDKRVAEKYFEVDGSKCRVKDDIRELVRFEKHNLISDPGLKFMDVIFCRNVMIYFKKEQQELLMKKFHDVLNPGGYLVIAKVESIWDKSLFAPVDLIRKIYRKV